jgi:hypothetical protein
MLMTPQNAITPASSGIPRLTKAVIWKMLAHSSLALFPNGGPVTHEEMPGGRGRNEIKRNRSAASIVGTPRRKLEKFFANL